MNRLYAWGELSTVTIEADKSQPRKRIWRGSVVGKDKEGYNVGEREFIVQDGFVHFQGHKRKLNTDCLV